MPAKPLRLFLLLVGAGCLGLLPLDSLPGACAQSAPGSPNTQPIKETLKKLEDVHRQAQEKVADLVQKATGFIEEQVSDEKKVPDEEVPLEVDLKD
ncbi:MAG: hypothetical protein KC931_27090, partial [Candidatus Omnitrophica bacterium]|nr:hypothetical protein [Candidatus Omnitrophota bacterium]